MVQGLGLWLGCGSWVVVMGLGGRMLQLPAGVDLGCSSVDGS